MHHKIKRSQRGNDSLENLVTLCAYCHMAEHGQLFYSVPAVRVCNKPKPPCTGRNGIGGRRKKRGSQRPRAILRREVHGAQEPLEAEGFDRTAGGHNCSYTASAFPAADPLRSEKASAMRSISEAVEACSG